METQGWGRKGKYILSLRFFYQKFVFWVHCETAAIAEFHERKDTFRVLFNASELCYVFVMQYIRREARETKFFMSVYM